MKSIKKTRIIWLGFICFLLLFLTVILLIINKLPIFNLDGAIYEREEAFVFDNTYTYGIGVRKDGVYTVKVKGDSLKDKTIMVNGVIQEETFNGNKFNAYLNKGINSISIDDGFDIENIIIMGEGDRNSVGAFVTYDSYEAEDYDTNGVISNNSRIYREFASEASRRGYVSLNDIGDYVSLKLKNDTNALVIRYCIPDSDDGKGINSSLNLYMGEDLKRVELTSRYSWVYSNFPWSNNPSMASKGGPHMFFDDVRVVLDKTYPAGTELKLIKEAGNSAEYYLIDLIETEEISAPLAQPGNALNVLDYGAIADDGQDDAKAISACIEEAIALEKEVYIPAGVFEIGNPVFINGFVLRDNNITIRGAGMWHTILHGNAAGFTIRAGNISLYDFSLLGEVTQRKDSIDPPAINMVTPVKGMENIRIQNLWIEHYKVGLWADVTYGINMLGCRIRNTFADGINLCGGTSNCVITQNDIRNTGDDGIAMFNRGVLEVNNKIIYNTVSLPWLANNIALYGGKDMVIKGNWLKDTICFGGGINISTNFKPKVFEGTILIEGNKLERCGSRENNINVDYGAIWINTVENYPNQANCIIRNNEIQDSTYQGVSLYNKGLLENMIIEDNNINGCGTYGIEIGRETVGNATIRNNRITNAQAGDIYDNSNLNFQIIKDREK
ncbi:MAG TPA: hypothetical protein GXZ21_05930 [Clostridiales bacterium]|nr:hypothetical protein [Clostridiales bacterium]